MIRHITSRSNPRIKSFLKEKQNHFFFEGEKMVRDLLKRKIPIHRLIIGRPHESEFKIRLHQVEEMWVASPTVLEKLSSLKETPDFMALVKHRPDMIHLERESLVLVLDSVQDPGNAGTVFRCAAAFGIETIIFCGNSVKPTNPKFVRTAQTALFDIRFGHVTHLSKLISRAQKQGLEIYLTTPHLSKRTLSMEKIKPPALVVFGNEGRGLPAELLSRLPVVTIEQKREVESLNVGISACILMHELAKTIHL